MEPIVLNKTGDRLLPYSGTDLAGTTWQTILFASSRDDRHGKDLIGTHECCNGTMRLKKSSKTHNALLCENCGLRIVLPCKIETYANLRQWCFENAGN